MKENTKAIILLVGVSLFFLVIIIWGILWIGTPLYENKIPTIPTKVIHHVNIEKQCILDCSDGYRGTSSDCNLFDLRNITDLEKYDCQVTVTETRKGKLTLE